MRLYTVCATHNLRVLVGPGSLLEEYECPVCVDTRPPAPTDPEALLASRITSHDNGNCCCESCDPTYCCDCGHYANFCTCPVVPVPVSLVRRRPKHVLF